MSQETAVDKQLDRIESEISSLQAQLRSLIASINSNNVDQQTRLGHLEVMVENHRERETLLHAALDARLAAVAAIDTRLGVVEKVLEQAKGAAVVWRVVSGTAIVGGALIETYLHTRGH